MLVWLCGCACLCVDSFVITSLPQGHLPRHPRRAIRHLPHSPHSSSLFITLPYFLLTLSRDSFILAFHDAPSAVRCAAEVQSELLACDWPAGMYAALPTCARLYVSWSAAAVPKTVASLRSGLHLHSFFSAAPMQEQGADSDESAPCTPTRLSRLEMVASSPSAAPCEPRRRLGMSASLTLALSNAKEAAARTLSFAGGGAPAPNSNQVPHVLPSSLLALSNNNGSTPMANRDSPSMLPRRHTAISSQPSLMAYLRSYFQPRQRGTGPLSATVGDYLLQLPLRTEPGEGHVLVLVGLRVRMGMATGVDVWSIERHLGV